MKRIILALGGALSVSAMALAAFLLLPVLAGIALAAEAVTSTPDTSVHVSGFASLVAEYFLSALATVAGGLVAYVANLVKVKLGLDIEARHREALQIALVNAAGMLVRKGVTSLDDVTIDVKNPLIKAAIEYVEGAAGDALKRFKLGPEDIAAKIANKLPLISPPVLPAVEIVPAPAA